MTKLEELTGPLYAELKQLTLNMQEKALEGNREAYNKIKETRDVMSSFIYYLEDVYK